MQRSYLSNLQKKNTDPDIVPVRFLPGGLKTVGVLILIRKMALEEGVKHLPHSRTVDLVELWSSFKVKVTGNPIGNLLEHISLGYLWKQNCGQNT